MFDFPNSPTTNQRATGSGGQVYTFDGTKWVATATMPGVTAWNSRTGNVTMTGGDVTTALAYTPYDAANPSGYQTAAQVTAAVAPTAQMAQDNVGRNLVHNPVYTVAQRGTGPWTANGYTLDRWWMHATTDTFSVSRTLFADSGRTQLGDEAATYHWDNAFVGNAAAGANNAVTQPIEDVRRLSNKTVTVSFWATCASGTPKLGVSLDQTFGTGGTPSANVNGNGQSVTLSSTTWARYSLTFAVPSVSGMTLGTNGDSATYLNFWFSSGATNATRSGNVGVQSNTISLWGIQLEYGSVATALDKGGTPQQQLAECQRFYQVGAVQLNMYGQTGFGVIIPLPVQMRSNPTVTPNFTTTTNCSGLVLNPSTAGYGLQLSGTVTAAGIFNAAGSYTASADL